MPRQRSIEDYSTEELRQLLTERRRAERDARLEAFRKTGRVIRVENIPIENRAGQKDEREPEGGTPTNQTRRARTKRHGNMDRLLLAVEIIAILGLVFIILNSFSILQNLNKEFASALEPEVTATALITAVVLPSGHTAPIAGVEVRPNEAEIPEHLRPLMQSYADLPIPTPGAQQARQIQIPAIGVNAPVVLGDGWEQLKKGIGQHLGTANPGEMGNLVVSAHNDIFGELFKDLDRLKPGDEIIVMTQDRSYTYVITGTQIVEPTRVDLMAPTPEKTITLISCYPYRIDTERIVVTAILEE
jgi:sortase A